MKKSKTRTRKKVLQFSEEEGDIYEKLKKRKDLKNIDGYELDDDLSKIEDADTFEADSETEEI